jgi:ribose-phosphate pyrophosphokinase
MTLVLGLPGNEEAATRLADGIGGRVAQKTMRRFPDGETYVRIDEDVEGVEVALVCPLNDPDAKLLRVFLAAETLRDLGAERVGLVAPYLAYLRQDIRFRDGEGITSQYIGRWLSTAFDWLVCVEPHLHRYDSLDEVYSIPATRVRAARPMARWVESEVERPLLIGPDSESEQWVSEVAGEADLPHVVLQKQRRGDRDVEVTIPDLNRWHDHTPVLVDDIISTGRTMAETAEGLIEQGLPAPICLAVHGLLADGALEGLKTAGVKRVVTTNTVEGATTAIDVWPRISEAVATQRATASR